MRRGILAALVLVMAGCSGDSGGGRSASDTITAYLSARVAADADAMRRLACDAHEAEIEIEAQSFRGMDVSLVEPNCHETAQGDGFVEVTCDGTMSFVYGTETRTRPLGTFRLVQEDGEWKMCGEA